MYRLYNKYELRYGFNNDQSNRILDSLADRITLDDLVGEHPLTASKSFALSDSEQRDATQKTQDNTALRLIANLRRSSDEEIVNQLKASVPGTVERATSSLATDASAAEIITAIVTGAGT